MAMAQLSGEPTLRGPEPIPFFHGKHASAAEPQRLRVLPDAPGCFAEKIRPAAREPQSARGKADPAAAFRRRGSAQGNDRFYRQACLGKYSRDVVQDPRSSDRQVNRSTAR